MGDSGGDEGFFHIGKGQQIFDRSGNELAKNGKLGTI